MSAAQVPASHYRWLSYVDRRRWASYWYQIRETLLLEPRSCLVVGKGDDTVRDALARSAVRVVTTDLDAAVRPDVVADVRALPFRDGAFDVVLCAQVLEHLPFAEFDRCIRELSRVAAAGVVLSLPQRGRSWEFALWIPFGPRVHVGGKLPARTRPTFDGQHHWELGWRTVPRRAVRDRLAQAFRIDREFVVPDNPYHRFYVLRARGGRA